MRRPSGRGSRLGLLIRLLLLLLLLGRRGHSLARLLLLVVVDVTSGTALRSRSGRSPALLVRLVGRILGVWWWSSDVVRHSMAGVATWAAGYAVGWWAGRWRLAGLTAGAAR